MIKRIKKLIIILIIFSFVFPLYADSSPIVGDYVPHSEFDEILESFNNRMSAFEAGVNSKIDAQVTSYLDRYGIWTSTAQIINESDREQSFYPTYSRDETTYWHDGSSEEWGYFNYIDNINKSGLLFGSYTWRNKSGSNTTNARFGWTGRMNETDNWRSDLGMCFMIDLYEITDMGIEEKKFTNILFQAMGTVDEPNGAGFTHTLAAPLPSNPVTNQFQFFVNKDDSLKWKTQCIFHFGFCQAAIPMQGEDNKILITMQGADVY